IADVTTGLLAVLMVVFRKPLIRLGLRENERSFRRSYSETYVHILEWVTLVAASIIAIGAFVSAFA
ncbi:MAG: hypothetical protein ACJ76U_00615, partial [Gaiellaceae bacterium]